MGMITDKRFTMSSVFIAEPKDVVLAILQVIHSYSRGSIAAE
jgi:hypothetical protein